MDGVARWRERGAGGRKRRGGRARAWWKRPENGRWRARVVAGRERWRARTAERRAARVRAGRREREREAAWEREWAERRRPRAGRVVRAVVMLVAFVGMVAFAVLLARVTLVPSPASRSLVHANFRPLASIRAYLDQPDWRDSVKQIGGNVVLGVPFGMLLPVLFPRTRGLVRVVVVTAFVMLCVETAQGTLVEGRAFDIDDVILNTAGALLGYLLVGRLVGRALHPRRRHWWQSYRVARVRERAGLRASRSSVPPSP
ncbi:VanZ family protein [Streptomyces sp. ICBB 8177]|uniref:VanZ family protein n=1 Tax=Streptomyces sp. ICBB 8177 TaxID=563922 RepID=UPI001F543A4C|nr:VanZ family protein [Streptomyces sp. ICBB 8177]